MKSLLAVRCPPRWVSQLAVNPYRQKLWPGLVSLHQVDRHLFPCDAAYQDTPSESEREPVVKLLNEIIERHNVTHALVTQKLLWYSDVVEQVYRARGVDLTWCEMFFDYRAIFDRSGLHYCRRNDLEDYGGLPMEWGNPRFPRSDRQAQPAEMDRENLSQKLNASGGEIVVFGQVPHDMALREFPGLTYAEWLHQLFTRNPQTTFLFKHHPLAPTEGVEQHPNVRVVNENLRSLLLAFSYFAAFSSTTIFEGAILGKRFLTGGYHLLRGHSLQASRAEDLENARAKLAGQDDIQQNECLPRRRRLAFICNAYALRLDGLALVERLTRSSTDFFQGGFWRL
jgi:hypothetical protein